MSLRRAAGAPGSLLPEPILEQRPGESLPGVALPTCPGASNPGPSSGYFTPIQGKVDSGDLSTILWMRCGGNKQIAELFLLVSAHPPRGSW